MMTSSSVESALGQSVPGEPKGAVVLYEELRSRIVHLHRAPGTRLTELLQRLQRVLDREESGQRLAEFRTEHLRMLLARINQVLTIDPLGGPAPGAGGQP